MELPPAFNQRAREISLLIDAEVIKKAADAHSRTPAQVLLRWATQRDIAVIPKSNNSSRLKQNLEVLDFDLSAKELEEIVGMNIGLRFNDPGFYLPNFPLRIFA